MLRTPLRRSEWLSRASGRDVYLKLETLQPTFSYKIRGAWNAVLALAERQQSPSLVTASAGNHGRALAHAASAAGMHLRVYVPAGAPSVKVDAIRLLGVDVRSSADYDAAEREAKEDARRSGAVYVSPYSHQDVIAGAGTIGLEIVQDLPRVDLIVVPVGGGGLISGIAIAAHGGTATVVGVEAAASSPFAHSLAAGRVVPITVMPTLADGLAGNLDPDTMTFDIVRRLVGEMTTVAEAEIRSAMSSIAIEERVIAEGAAATAVAAVLGGRIGREAAGQTIAVVLSGANVDPAKLREII